MDLEPEISVFGRVPEGHLVVTVDRAVKSGMVIETFPVTGLLTNSFFTH
jgi:hypothetical protein